MPPIRDALKDLLDDRALATIQRLQKLKDTSPLAQAPVPDDAPVCADCLGYGFVHYDLPFTHPDFGKAQPCPNPDCPIARERAIDRANRLNAIYAVDMDKAYEDYTFATWKKQIPARKEAGKTLPYLVAKFFARHPGQHFALSDVLRDARIPFVPDTDEDGVDWLVADIRGHEERFQNSYGGWLVFQGAYGTGKTGLSIALLNALKKSGVFAFYIHLPTFIQLFQDTYVLKHEPEEMHKAQERLTKPLIDAQVLLVDEVNVAHSPDGQAHNDKIRILTNTIIQPRWVAGSAKPTILTTNKSFDEFERHWDGLIASRVAERAHWLRFMGEPLRHQNRPV